MYQDHGSGPAKVRSGLGRSIDCAEQTKIEIQRHTESREGHRKLMETIGAMRIKAGSTITGPPLYLPDPVEDDLLEIVRLATKIELWAKKRVNEQEKILTEMRASAKEAADGSS